MFAIFVPVIQANFNEKVDMLSIYQENDVLHNVLQLTLNISLSFPNHSRPCLDSQYSEKLHKNAPATICYQTQQTHCQQTLASRAIHPVERSSTEPKVATITVNWKNDHGDIICRMSTKVDRRWEKSWETFECRLFSILHLQKCSDNRTSQSRRFSISGLVEL